MSETTCPFCKKPAIIRPVALTTIKSYRCGICGEYALTHSIHMGGLNDLDKLKLHHISCLLHEHKLKRAAPLVITYERSEKDTFDKYVVVALNDLLNKYPKDANEFISRSLLNLARTISKPSQSILISDEHKALLFAEDNNDIGYILRQLHGNRYISTSGGLPVQFTIEPNGWKQIKALNSMPLGLQNQAFVAMWFDESMENYYVNGIKKAIEEATDYKSVRVDLVDHNNKICDQIIAEINRSKFLVADFTKQRGGVYYEAGYAQGKGIPVIWTVHEDEVDDLHFDTRQYNHIAYKSEVELYNKLFARIKATIELN